MPLTKEKPLADTMRVNNKINDVHSGKTPLNQDYRGRNVIMGFIDTGIDFAHPDFRDANDKTRILHLWDQTKGNAANTPNYGYGQEWDSTAINAGSCTNQDQWGHGSSVSGAGAGNGLANGTHMGVAPESWIIAVESRFNATDWLSTVVDATEYIYSKADDHNMPCVINASLGTYLGSHDGLDPYSLYIDSLINEKRGRLFVASLGNSGDWDKYHLHTDVTADTSFSWFTANPSSAFGGTAGFWEIWADTADFNNVNYAIGADKVNPNYEFRGRTIFHQIASNLNVIIEDTIWNNSGDMLATTQTWAEQRDGQYLIQVYMPSPDSSDYFFRFETFGAGSFDCWSRENYGMSKIIDTIPTLSVYPELADYVLPDSLQSMVSAFQCSPHVISVGNYVNDSGYVSKYNQWIGSGYERGSLFKSSSKGPTRLGLVKPEICATGQGTGGPAPLFRINQWVTANVDSTLHYGGMHMSNGGTSMASPVVACVGALLLEKCPTMNQEEYRNVIINSAYNDVYTGSANLPNMAWGYGKLDGFSAVSSTNYQVNHTGDLFFCHDESTTVAIDPNYETVEWENGSNDFTQNFNFDDTTYAITTDSAGCYSDTLSLIIIGQDQVIVNQITSPFYHCEGDSIFFSATGENIYNASWQDGLEDTTRYLSGTQTTYLIAKDSVGCLSDTAWVSVIENLNPNTPVLSTNIDTLFTDDGYVNYNWYLDGNLVTSTFENFLVISQNGDYTVEVTNLEGCTTNSTILPFNSVNINSDIAESFFIYPNPSKDVVNLDYPGSFEVVIYDAKGKKIAQRQEIEQHLQIDLSKEKNGVYFVQIFTEKGSFVQKINLIK